MKKVILAIGLIAVLAFGSAAYAYMYGPGYGGGYGGYGGYGMMGGGYGMMGGGYGMMGGGYGMMGGGYGMMGPGYGYMWGGTTSKETQKFLEETADLRRDMQTKMFDYREAYWAGDKDKAEALEKELTELRDKLYEKGGFDTRRGYGFGPGHGYCDGPYGR